jgi:DHA2 family multidrug resistance protein
MQDTPSLSVERPISLRTAAGFVVMCVGMFLAILDVQIVATSLPTIRFELDIDAAAMSWIQTAYLVAEVVAIPLTGFLTRVLTMRWLFVLAVLFFSIASLGCSQSTSFSTLISWRILQGFSGGTLIPAVFAAVFLLFPVRHQASATTLAGVLAVLAPTVGPIIGGWITDTYAWNWLFLVNVPPGIAAALLASLLLPKQRTNLGHLRTLDIVSLVALAVGLSALEIALTQAPRNGWGSPFILGLVALSLASSVLFIARTLRSASPVVDLTLFAERNFTVGCVLSFALGVGLFGTIYLMPIFLGLVRQHNAFEIGEIMLVTGVAQLITAPLAVVLEKRMDPRLLSIVGFAMFGVGLSLSARQTITTDFAGMFWPQVIRGVAIMFCLLPPTSLALGLLQPARVADASGLFNLMRNLGGAVGLALIDSVIYGRVPTIAAGILEKLKAGDVATARAIGLPLDQFLARRNLPLDEATKTAVASFVGKAALTQAVNAAWAMVAIITIASIGILLFAGSRYRAGKFSVQVAPEI